MLITIIGSIILTGNKKVKYEEDILTYQNTLENTFSSYGFTFDNPKVIVNPYKISPLTALVIFQTTDKVAVDVTIKGKNNDDYTYTLSENTIHYLPIYYLYPDYNNEVIIKIKDKEHKINIKTDPITSNIENYPHYSDDNNVIRWYLTKEYKGRITKLKNNHYLLGSDKLDNSNHSISLMEIDLLGKVYYEYLLPNGYYGLSCEINDNILVLTDKLVEFDKQTMQVINEYKVDGDYNYLIYNNDKIILQNDKQALSIDYKNKDKEDSSLVKIPKLELKASNLKLGKGVRLGTLDETKKEKIRIALLKYDKYNKDLDITKEYNRLVIKLDTKDEVYVILDQFLDKRIYKLENNILYINDTGLKGKYTIYLKIGDKIYKTNYFVSY